MVLPVFVLIGFGTMFLGAFVATARDVVREERGTLVFAVTVLGREWRPRRVAWRDIEAIDIGSAAEPVYRERGGLSVQGIPIIRGRLEKRPRRQEVVVRWKQDVLRLGSGLSAEEHRWLRDALTAMASGG